MPRASLLMQDPGVMTDRLIPLKERGFRAFKFGWGPLGRRDKATDEAIVRASPEAIGPDCRLMIDAGGWKLNADGTLPIPDRPGLGVTIDLDPVERYTGVMNLLA